MEARAPTRVCTVPAAGEASRAAGREMRELAEHEIVIECFELLLKQAEQRWEIRGEGVRSSRYSRRCADDEGERARVGGRGGPRGPRGAGGGGWAGLRRPPRSPCAGRPQARVRIGGVGVEATSFAAKKTWSATKKVVKTTKKVGWLLCCCGIDCRVIGPAVVAMLWLPCAGDDGGERRRLRWRQEGRPRAGRVLALRRRRGRARAAWKEGPLKKRGEKWTGLQRHLCCGATVLLLRARQDGGAPRQGATQRVSSLAGALGGGGRNGDRRRHASSSWSPPTTAAALAHALARPSSPSPTLRPRLTRRLRPPRTRPPPPPGAPPPPPLVRSHRAVVASAIEPPRSRVASSTSSAR